MSDEDMDALSIAYMKGKRRGQALSRATIATLTAERDEQLRLNQIGHEREAALMTDSLLKADEIKWLKAKLHLAVADLDKARRERDALVEAVRRANAVSGRSMSLVDIPEDEWAEVIALAQQDQPAGEVLDADTLTIYFRGDITKPHSLTSEDYDKLKASGMLWELYPDAPDHFIAATAR